MRAARIGLPQVVNPGRLSPRRSPRGPILGCRSNRVHALRVLATADHDLTIVVPAYNEENRLPATLDGLAAYLDPWGIDYRVLVIDDGSRDRGNRIHRAIWTTVLDDFASERRQRSSGSQRRFALHGARRGFH